MAEVKTIDQVTQESLLQGGPPAPANNNRAAITAAAVQNPPAPLAYQYLNVGPETSIELSGLTADQVETSDALLRNLSPFVIQIEPPGVFESYNVGANAPDSPQIGLYQGAAGAAQSYQNARDALSQDAGVKGLSEIRATTDPEQFVASQAYQVNAETVDWENLPDGTQLGSDQTSNIPPAMPDLLSVQDIRLQVANIINMPPLVLLINPTTFGVQYTKIQQYQDRSRYGYILHMWGEDQVKISFTARCGAFISGGRGLHVASRHDSKAWQNMENLMRFFKNNGYIYDTIGKSNAHFHVGGISIRYDGMIYYGNMESFSFEHNESNQMGGVEFSVEFTANGIVDTSHQTNVVSPMRSPIPQLNRQAQAPRSGSVGMSRNTTSMAAPQNVNPGDSLNTIIPPSGTGRPLVATTNQGSTALPVGGQGFRRGAVTATGNRTLTQQDTNQSRPFGF